MLRIYETILEVVAGLRPVIGQIERRDGDLARQMRRAACSVVLNTAEGMNSGGGNRPARYQTAAGSMRETLACVEVGVALGYVAGATNPAELFAVVTESFFEETEEPEAAPSRSLRTSFYSQHSAAR